MNGRYTLVVVLLLGAFVFGLSTFVSDMFSEEPLAGSVSFAPSSVSRVGASAGGASSYHTANVPCVQMSGANYSLFHHHTASVPTYTPSSVGGYSSTPYIGSSSVAGSSDGQGATSSSAYGIYLTSSATTRSYGASSAASSASAYSSGAGGTASSYSASSVYSPVSSVGTSSAFAYSSAAYSSANYASAQSAAPSISLSADQTLAARSEAPNRRKSKGASTIDGAWTNWLETEWAGGRDDLTIDELRALYDKMRAEDAQFAETYTWQDFLDWFGYRQQDDTFRWHLPIGNGVPVLLVLSLLWLLYKYLALKRLSNIEK